MTRAVEQPNFQLAFERAYLLAHRGLGHTEPLGGPVEVLGCGYRDEVAEMPELHAGSLGDKRRLSSTAQNRGREILVDCRKRAVLL